MSEPPAPDPGKKRQRVRRRVRVPETDAEREARHARARWRSRARRWGKWAAVWGGIMLAGAVLLYVVFSRMNLEPRPPAD